MRIRPMTHELRKKIAEYRKTQEDITHLISDVDIKGEDLSRCIISDLQVADRDISGCDFTGSTMKICAKKSRARDCKFVRCKLLPGSSLRGADLRRSNFFEADCGFVDYAYSDLRGCNICGAQFSFASKLGYKAKVSRNIVELLGKWWDIVDGDPMQDTDNP